MLRATAASQISADLITPLGAYLRLRDNEPSFLLESVEQGRLGRYSFLGTGARLLSFEDAEVALEGGAPVVGYLGYDHVARLEPTVPLPDEGPDLPESLFVVAHTLVRFDHLAGLAEVLAGDPEEVAARLAGPLVEPPASTGHARRATPALSVPGPVRARRPAGQGLHPGGRRVPDRPLAARRAARRRRPQWRSTGRSGASTPRRTSSCSSSATSPSSAPRPRRSSSSRERGPASTRSRGRRGPGEGDAERLLASEKDRAEHVMLVDLGRNDLSRVCAAGSVRVERFLAAERYSHVTHLVSEVVGDLRPGVSPFDLLRATFPAGTVSGAPKVRAMQIISELEGYRRGPYAGAVGYALPAASAFDTCIGIRTIVLRDGLAYLQAGAGIVADSDPTAENQECLNKLAALQAAIDLAEAS